MLIKYTAFCKEWEEFKKDYEELKERVKKIEDFPAISEVRKTEEQEKKSAEPAPVPNFGDASPVPPDFRAIVDTCLNRLFGVSVIPRSDSPHFEFIISVPDKYTPTTSEQRRMLGGQDIRAKVVGYAEGLNGVRLYTEKVFESFNPEIKAMIVADRI